MNQSFAEGLYDEVMKNHNKEGKSDFIFIDGNHVKNPLNQTTLDEGTIKYFYVK